MLQKYLQKKAENFKSKSILPDLLRKIITKVQSASTNRIDATSVELVCSQLLNAGQKLSIPKHQPQIRQILALVNSLLLEIHYDQIYQLYIIKIRQFLLSLAVAKNNPYQYRQKQKRIVFYLQKVQNSEFYPLLQQDFYSSLQLVYIQAIKKHLTAANPSEALKSSKTAFQALKKQIIILVDSANLSCSDKMDKLLQKKRKTLQILFFLQYGANVSNSNIVSDKIAEQLIPKYAKLFNRIMMDFEPNELIARAVKALQAIQGQDEQEYVEQRQKGERNSIVSNSSSQQSSSHLLQPYVSSVLNSVNFIDQSEPIRKNSSNVDLLNSLKVSQVHHNRASKISIMLESHPSIPQEDFTRPNKSVFASSNPLKTSKNEEKKDQKPSKFLKEIENMIAEQRHSESKKKSKKEYRTRKFSMVAREQQRDKERVKKLKIGSQEMQKLKVSQGQMLKNGIILV